MQMRRDGLFDGIVPAGLFVRSVSVFEVSSSGMFGNRFEWCSVQLIFATHLPGVKLSPFSHSSAYN